MGVGSLGSTKKPAISPKRCKIGPRLLLWTNRKSYTRFRLVPKSVTLNNLERRIQGLPKVFKYTLFISETDKATDFKFGLYNLRVHANKSPLKILQKRAWAYPGAAQNFKVPPISSGTGKATNFKFCTHFHTTDYNKSPLTISGKIAMGVARDSQHFSGIHI